MKFIKLLIILLIPLTIFPFAANSFAVCTLEDLTSYEIPFSYPDRNQTTLNVDTISTREIAGRLLSYISINDALKILESVGATDLEPITNAEGAVTITFDTVLHEVREYLTGECAGVTIGPYNRTVVYFSVYNKNTGRTDLAYVAVLADTPISPSVSHPDIYETDAKIEVELEREKDEDGGGKFKFKAKTKKDNFFIQFSLIIPADAEYRLNAANLKALDTLFFLFPLSPDLLRFGEWADLHRMRYISQEGDKLEIKTRNKDGKVCFNPQSGIAGKDVCVTLLKDGKGKIRTAQGRIHRRNELFLEHVDF
jgi:hypothetical protein